MPYKLTRDEQETVINWDARRSAALVYTANPADLRRLRMLSEQYPDVYKCIWNDPNGTAAKFRCPKRYVRFRKPTDKTNTTPGGPDYPENPSILGDSDSYHPPPDK